MTKKRDANKGRDAAKSGDGARFSYEGLDRVIHERARLGVMTSLMAHRDGLAFSDLRELCDLTDGNLSRHLQVLQEAELVEISKGYEGNRPHTSCRLTRVGRKRFVDYLAVLEDVVRDASQAKGNVGKREEVPARRGRLRPA